MAGARALWRATGMTDDDFDKPIVAVANSFTQFVPGHVHLKDLGQLVAREIAAAGGVAKEFNTIAVDDGIAMGHGGMLYSLPSRDLIADSVEYMVNAHCADALVCISNCDKITPGMLIAAMRLNVPTVFVSGGPMEAGKTKLAGVSVKLDLINPMISAGDSSVSDEDLLEMERSACPTCGSCSGMFTANSMNCLTEALGLSLPGNGTVLATHSDRRELFLRSRPPGGRSGPPLLREGRRVGAAPLDRHQDRLRERHTPRHRHGRFHQHRASHPGRGPRGRGGLHHGRHRQAEPQHPQHLQGGPVHLGVSRRRRAPGRRHHGHPGRARPGRAAGHVGLDRAFGHAGRRPRGVGRDARPVQRRCRVLPGRPGRHPHPGGVQPVHPMADARPRPRSWLHPHGRRSLQRRRRAGRALRQHRHRRLHCQDRRRGRVDLPVLGTGEGVREPG